jgi:hypothetical protein
MRVIRFFTARHRCPRILSLFVNIGTFGKRASACTANRPTAEQTNRSERVRAAASGSKGTVDTLKHTVARRICASRYQSRNDLYELVSTARKPVGGMTEPTARQIPNEPKLLPSEFSAFKKFERILLSFYIDPRISNLRLF